jgi:peroxiredoxin Q/BCP
MSQSLLPGSKAPDFSALDQDGNILSLSDYLGKKVVLYFYPHDNTESCTNQACNLRDNFSLLKKHKITVLGVSTDSQKSHKKFADKYNLPFTLIVDEDRKIVNLYKVWQWKQFMGRTYEGIVRTTFLIDEKGIIVHIIDKVKTKNHTEQIAAFWNLT